MKRNVFSELSAMTPVTVFKDQTVAVFGLGGSGLVTAEALKAGGAHVIAYDDAERSRAKAAAAGITVQDLTTIDWTTVAALVLAQRMARTPAMRWAMAGMFCASGRSASVIHRQ